MTDYVYAFSFPASLTGLTVTVYDDSGDTVNTGTLGSPSGNSLTYKATLPLGEYVGVVTSATHAEFGNITHATDHPAVVTTAGIFDTPASIANSGASEAETAKFIGTGTSDTSGTEFPVVFTQDPDGVVDWAEVVAGDIKLTGPLRFNINARQGGTADFSGATGYSTATTETGIEGFVYYQSDTGFGLLSAWNDYKIPVGTPGDTFDVDAPLSSNHTTGPLSNTANHQVTINATIAASGFDEAGEHVNDGVYDGVWVVWITKSDLPPLPA